MKTYIIEGKTEEEIIDKAKKDLKVEEEEIILRFLEEKSGFLKSKKKSAIVIKKEEIVDCSTKYIKKILELMGITVNLESKIRKDNIQFLLATNQNALLIGKNGKTIEAFQFLLGQMIYKETGAYTRISLDIGEYRLKKQKRIEFLAKRTAQIVIRKKSSVKLNPMNSYERRVVHTILSEYVGVTTLSEGEGQERHIIIKPKE